LPHIVGRLISLPLAAETASSGLALSDGTYMISSQRRQAARPGQAEESSWLGLGWMRPIYFEQAPGMT
jgi:hypothetical protein